MGLSIKQNIAEYREFPSELQGGTDNEIPSIMNPEAQHPDPTPQLVEDNTGLELEKTEKDNEEIEQDKEFVTDENGNEVFTETEDGEVIRRTIRSKDQSGNLIETIINYYDGKPVKKVKKKNGNTISSTKFTYHSENESEAEYVTLETDYPNRTRVKTNVLSTDEYGNYDEAGFISETTTKPDGTTTKIIKYNGKIVETETRFDGTVTKTVYNGSDLSEYHSGSLNRLEQTVTQNGSSTTVRYDDNGNRLETTETYDTGLKVDIETVKQEVADRGITNIEVTEENAQLLHTILTATPIIHKYSRLEVQCVVELLDMNHDRNTIYKLIEMKNPDGSSRFTAGEIDLLSEKDYNQNTINKFTEMRNPDNSYRFDANEIRKLSNENLDQSAVDKFLEMTNQDGSFRFNGNEITVLSNKDLDQNLVDKLVEMTNSDGSLRFNGNEIASLTNKNLDQSAVDKFLEMTNQDGSFRFNAYQITELSNQDLDQSLVDKFLEMKNPDGSFRFYGWEIPRLSDKNLDQNLVDKFIEMTNQDGSFRFNTYQIAELSNQDLDQSLVDKFLEMKNPDGSFRFYGWEISGLSDKNLDQNLVDKFIVMKKTDDESFRFDGAEIAVLSNKDLDQSQVDKFIEITNSDGSFRFDAYDIIKFSDEKMDYNKIKDFLKIQNLGADEIIMLTELSESDLDKYNEIVSTSLLELIDSGYITKEKCSQLFRRSAGINEHTSFSERTLSEIKLIKEQTDAGQKPSLVRKVPQDASAEWISKNIKTGDVYEQNGILFVREKDDFSTELNLTKETFDELFPPLSSSFTQGRLADCWLVSAIDNMMDKPQGRAAIFQMFEQDGDDILVKIPEGKKPVKFKNGEVFDNYGEQISGDKGIKMLEQAYAVHRQNHYDDTALSTFEINESTDISGLIQELSWGYTGEAWSNLTGKVSYIEGDFKKAAKFIEKNVSNPDVMIGIGFNAPAGVETGENGEFVIDKSYHLYGSHAYAIKGYDPETETVYLTNPWNTSTIIEVPMEMIKNHFKSIEIMEF